MVWIAAMGFLLWFVSTVKGTTDLTLQRDARGADVVRAVLARLSEVNPVDTITTSAEKQVIEQFIREMAYVETVDGTDYPQNSICDGGIWGVSRELFERTQQYGLPQLFAAISSAFCINWQDVQYSQLRSSLLWTCSESGIISVVQDQSTSPGYSY